MSSSTLTARPAGDGGDGVGTAGAGPEGGAEPRPKQRHCGRSLLFPGPQPPLSHFGATLLRHVVSTACRYALYHLGCPMPERSPVRILRLRLYLDLDELAQTVGEDRSELARALVDPGGRVEGRGLDSRTAAAAAFHRFRLTLGRRRPPPPRPRPSAHPHELHDRFRRRLRRAQPALNDAFLAEALAALARRRRRTAGERVAPVAGRESWRLRRGRNARLTHLGTADIRDRSWAADLDRVGHAASLVSDQEMPRRDRLRGAFRETWRAALEGLRADYRALATNAAQRGLLSEADDAFFIPYDLAEDLTLAEAPGWLRPGVLFNRHEYESMLGLEAPPEVIDGPVPDPRVLVGDDPWDAAPLWPLL